MIVSSLPVHIVGLLDNEVDPTGWVAEALDLDLTIVEAPAVDIVYTENHCYLVAILLKSHQIFIIFNS
jgi:hypothetical protein